MKRVNANTVQATTSTVSGLVDGTNLTELNERSLKKNKEQTISGQYTFKNVTKFFEDVHIEDSINNIRFEEVITTSTQQNITANLVFKDNVTITNNVQFNQFTLNGIDVDSIMTKGDQQTVTGSKTYTSPIEFKNVHLDGLLNSVDIAEYANSKVSLTKNEVVTGHIRFAEGFTVNSDVLVDGFVDGVNITALFESLNADKSKDETVSGL